MSDTTTTTAPSTADATGATPGQNGGSSAATTSPASPAIAFESEAAFQERVESILKERLERERKKATEATAKAKADAEAQALAKSGEWEKLASDRAAQLATLEAQAAQLTAQLEAQTAAMAAQDKALRAQLDALRKNVAKPVLGLLDKLTPAEQLEWLAANQEAAQPLPKPAGVPGTPKPAGQLDAAQTEAGRAAVAAQYREL